MRYVLALGVGRSGTTLLGRIIASTATPARFVSELCPGIPDRIPNPHFMVEPGDDATICRVRDAVTLLGAGKTPFGAAQAHRIERDDPDAEVVVIKDIHSLLAYPEILSGLDWRAVAITRETTRCLDSYFHGHARGRRHYLCDSYAYVCSRIDSLPPDSLLARAERGASRGVRTYLRRPRLFTTELFRQAAITEVLARFLRAWSAEDDRMTHVSFEALCRDPLGEAVRLFDFLDLDHDADTLTAVQRMTTGTSDDYYATDKDSRRVLEQRYKWLRGGRLRRVAAFLAEA
ncbi:MAG TPA: sulfotransferase [Myxococcota bacterium]|nr:sulfotransferase [Myxococcota bacterium]